MRTFLSCLSLLVLTLFVPVTGTTSSNPPRVECPTISIETPAPIICSDARVTFTASVTEGEVNAQQRFNWTVSAGRIIRGQGTPTIMVATTGAQGPGGVRVSVELVGPGNNCGLTFSHAVDVTPFCSDRKFDAFSGELSLEEEKARLANFAVRLRGEPDTLGLIIIYASPKTPVGEVEARRGRTVNYLLNEQGLEADRLYLMEETAPEDLRVELWVMPTKLPPATSSQTDNSSPAQLNSNTPKPAGP